MKLNIWKLISIALLVVVAYFLYSAFAPKGNRPQGRPATITPTTATQTRPVIPDNWKTYRNEYVSFRYPPEWKESDTISYPMHSIVTQFEYGPTLSIVLYDGQWFSEAQRQTGMSLDNLTFVNPEKYTDLKIDGHKAKRMHDALGKEGVSMPAERLAIDVPEKKIFIVIDFNNMFPSLGWDAFTTAWVEPVISSIKIGSVPDKVAARPIDFPTPPNWKKYSKKFQGLNFEFSYPEKCNISDWDEASGDIEVMCPESQNASALSIGRMVMGNSRLPVYGYTYPPEWFANKLIDDISTVIKFRRSNLSYSAVSFPSGQTLYSAKYVDSYNSFPYLSGEQNYYFFLQPKDTAIKIIDNKIFSKEETYAVLQSLKVSNP